MPLIKMTRELAHAAGWDAGDRSMRKAGRKTWNDEDANAASEEYARLWPLCEHGADIEHCALCSP